MRTYILILLLLVSMVTFGQTYSSRTQYIVRKSAVHLATPTTGNFNYTRTWCWNTTDSILYARENGVIVPKYKFYPYKATIPPIFTLSGTSTLSYSNTIYPFYVRTSATTGNVPSYSNFTYPNTWCWNTTDHCIYTKIAGQVVKTYSVYAYIPTEIGPPPAPINQPPLIANQAFSVPENSLNGVTVGNVIATDPDAGQSLTYSILSGNTGVAFAINSTSGKITVLNPSALNYEATTSFPLVVQVQDNGSGTLSNQANISVSVTNVNEPPIIVAQTFTLNQGASNGTTVGTVSSTEPDAGQTTAYSIVAGNTGSAFSINSSSGVLTVANSSAVAVGVFSLTVRVQDNGTGALSAQALITVNVFDNGGNNAVADWYISPTGNDANTGDITHPFKSLMKAWAVATAGDLIYMRGGTYVINTTQQLMSKSGTAGSLIKIWAYPGEHPILTKGSPFAAGSMGLFGGINLYNANYIHFKGIEITGFTQESGVIYRGVVAQNTSYCIWELMDIHHNGLGLGISHNSAGNLIVNCDFHHNADPLGTSGIPYNSADGLDISFIDGAAITGPANIVRGCRAFWNTDDGFDFYSNEGTIVIENSWAFWNGYFPDTFNSSGVSPNGGNGDGFKYGKTTTYTTNKRTTTNCLSFKNRMRGYDQNLGDCKMIFYNNTSYQNGGSRGFDFWYGSQPITVRNNISFGDGNVSTFTSTSVVDHNTFLLNGSTNSAYSVSNADFISVSSTGMDGARQSDGSLPVLNFLRPTTGSDLINTGINVGLPYLGTAPDLGGIEAQ